MQEYRITKKTLYLWYIYIFLAFGVLCILSLVVSYFWPTVSRAMVFISAAIGLFAVTFYLPAIRHGVRVRVSDTALSYTVGLFMRREHILPLDRLLFMQRVTTPISALMNMSSLRVKALGGYLVLPPMENKTVGEILSRCGRGQ